MKNRLPLAPLLQETRLAVWNFYLLKTINPIECAGSGTLVHNADEHKQPLSEIF